MEPERRYALMGAVLLVLAAGAVLALVWLSSSGRSSDYRFYTIYFQRQSLEGLQIGGDVTMRGVKVGRVEDYTISRENINRVAVTLRVARHTPVSENTKAVVARNILTGIARITLETPGTPGPELLDVPEGERFPVIPEGTSGLEQIADAATRLALSADQTLEQLNTLLGPANQRAMTEGLAAFRDLGRGLNARMSQLDATTRAVQTAAQGLHAATQALTEQAVPLGQDARLTLQQARTALQTLTESGQALERETRQTLRQVQHDSRQLGQQLDGALNLGLHELRTTTETLRSASDTLTRTVDRLQDPRALLLGPSPAQLGPGEDAP